MRERMSGLTRQTVERFQELHQQARHGLLDPAARALYDDARHQIDTALANLGPQALGRQRRRSARLPHTLKIDVRIAEDVFRTMTLDVSRHGFAFLAGEPVEIDARTRFAVRTLVGAITGTGRVVGVQPRGATYRVSVAIDTVSDPRQYEELVDQLLFETMRRFSSQSSGSA